MAKKHVYSNLEINVYSNLENENYNADVSVSKEKKFCGICKCEREKKEKLNKRK